MNTNIKKIKNGSSFDLNGWKYISISGKARERGYAHGYLIAPEFKNIQKMMQFVSMNDYGREWSYFIDGGVASLKPTIMEKFPEFYDEMVEEYKTDNIW